MADVDVNDKSTWATKQDVAKALHVTERTLELKIKKGEIRADTRSVPGRKPLVIIHPDDLALLQSKSVKLQPIPKSEVTKKVTAEIVSISKAKPKSEKIITFRNMREAMMAGVIQPPIHLIRWLSLAEAALLTGLPKDLLRSAVDKKELPAVTRGTRTFIKWTDLETYHPHGEIPKAKQIAKARNGSVSQAQISSENAEH
jgi:excisionase family DNA binding protein